MANPVDGPRAFGELFAFDDPEARFQIIDDLEGFDPVTGSGYYRRVLLPVETVTKRRVPAWAYVVKETAGRRIQGGRWLP
ncbi:MAG: gamma-glutamylcyclotransferase family protein [Rubrobacter sp.]